MNIRLAKSAGFCFGVRRAVDLVYEQVKSGVPIYTYGPIIHNEEVVRDLAEKGVVVVERIEHRGASRTAEGDCGDTGARRGEGGL